jgi:methylated-DNA-protein-cysteine methyltransferase-like protein
MNHDDLWDLVRQIPSGKVATYGDLGRALEHPTTGRMVGRWMANCPDDIPWWRVVNKRGALPIEKRNPYAAIDQRKRLEEEGVEFKGDFVDLREFLWVPEE